VTIGGKRVGRTITGTKELPPGFSERFGAGGPPLLGVNPSDILKGESSGISSETMAEARDRLAMLLNYMRGYNLKRVPKV
jgi:hypothetical protein